MACMKVKLISPRAMVWVIILPPFPPPCPTKNRICFIDMSMPYCRISTARKVKGWGRHFFHQIEPNWPLPYSTMPVPQLRDAKAGGLGHLLQYFREYNAKTQNRAGKGSILMWRRFTLIYLWSMHGQRLICRDYVIRGLLCTHSVLCAKGVAGLTTNFHNGRTSRPWTSRL